MSFGSKLKSLREGEGLTQTELAKAISDDNKKYSQRIISYYERDESGVGTPTDDILEKVASFFNVSKNSLLGVSKETSPELQLLDKIVKLTENKKVNWCPLENSVTYPGDKNYLDKLNRYLHSAFVHLKNKPTYKDINQQKSFVGNFSPESNLGNYDLWLFAFNNDSVYLSILLENEENNLIAYYDNKKVNGILTELLEIINSNNPVNQTAGIVELLKELEKFEEE